MTNTKVTKIVSGLVGFAMLFGAAAASAQTSSATLQAQIAALQAQLSAQGGSMMSCNFVFSANLSLGSKGQDVWNLQKTLNMSADTQVAFTGAGSPGNETSTFGPATKRAVLKFQAKYGISQVGSVGPITRAKLNSMCSSPVVTPGQPGTPVVVSGPLQVTLGTTASYGALVSPSATAILATYNFSGNGVVTNVTLNRNGVSTDNTLSNVYLYNGATRLTDAASVSSGIISFNNPSGLFTVNGGMTVTVRADIAANYGGNTVGVTLASYNTAGGNSVAVNLAGPVQTVATNSNAATVQVQSNGQIVAQSINAGTTAFQVWSAPIVVGTRSVKLEAVSFKYIGSAPTNALANIHLLVDGAQVGPIGAVNANGYLTFDLSSSPLVLNTGSHTMVVQADIVAGANRNFQISLQNSGDLMVADSQLQGVNVAPYTTSSTSGSPAVTTYNFTSAIGGLITINNGTLVVQTDSSFSPTTITGGAANVTIAQFKMTSYGEDVKVNSLAVEPQIGGVDTSLNNVGVYVNGGQVGSTMNDASTTLTFGSNNLFTIPAGQTVIVSIKADTISAQNTNYSSGSLTVKLPAGSSNAQGVQSSQITSVPSAAITSNGITLAVGGLTVGTNPAFSTGSSIVANQANQRIGSFVLQEGSSEAAQLTNITVGVTGSIPLTSLQNLKISLGNNTIGQLTASNNFSVNTLVPMNGSQIVDVYADVGQVNSTLTSNTRTITFSGTFAAGQLATTTISNAGSLGGTFTTGSFVAGTTAPTIASNMAALINASSTAGFTASANGAVLTLTATTSGTAANSYTVTAGQGGNAPATLTPVVTVTGGTAVSTANVQTTLTVTARGATSNVTISPAAATGQSVIIGSGSIASPTAVANASLNSQYIVGGASAVQYANFNFVSGTAPSTITEMHFSITGTQTAFTTVTVGGHQGNFSGGVATVTGLNIPVPITGGGVNVPVAVGLANVGTNGIASGSTAQLVLTYVGYSTGTSNTTVTSGLPVSASGTLTLTDSKPTITYGSSTGTHSGLNNDLIDITVTNDQNGGPLTIDTIPLSFTGNGVNFAAQNLTVKDSQGNTLTGVSAVATSTTSITGSGTSVGGIIFTGGYRLEHGASVTFYVTGTVTNNAPASAGSNTLLSSVGPAAGFTWSDLAGGDTAGSSAKTGTLTTNYPTSGGNTITN